jgi:thiol-disulfide isomerase/thioredoxin
VQTLKNLSKLKKMIKIVSGVAVVLLILGTYCAAEAETFPGFSSETLDGEPITNAIFAEKKLTMINIWAEWCGPCRSEMADLGELGRSMPEGSQLVGIIYDDKSSIDRTKKVAEDYNADFPHIWRSSEMSSYLTRVAAIPWTIFVDSTGTIVGEPIRGAHRGAFYRQTIETLLEQEGGNSVTLLVNGGGGVLTADKPVAKAGETVIVVYTPNNGYELDEVWAYKTGDEDTTVEDLSCTETECSFTMPDYPVTVAVSFKRADGDLPSYPIELPSETNVTNGTLTPDKAAAEAGETVTVICAPDDGYEFEAIWVYKADDESVTVPLFIDGNICTFTMPDYPVTISAAFKPSANGYRITLSYGLGGILRGHEFMTVGKAAQVFSSPDIGYELQSIWAYKDGDVNTIVPLDSIGNWHQFTMPAYPVMVRAEFRTAAGGYKYSIILPANPTGGRVVADKTAAAAGETVILTFIPNTGYSFNSAWAYNANNPSETVPLYCSGSICQFTMPAFPVTIVALFTSTSGSYPPPGGSTGNGGGGGCNVSVWGMGLLALTGAALLKKRN